MAHTLDLAPSTRELARVVRGIRDDQLGDPTPCPDYTVADLVDHVRGLTTAFTHAATKEPLTDGAGDDLAVGLDRLAAAWAEPTAYDGVTMAGPIEMAAPQAALVALDEVVVHGWDLAAATGQPYAADPTAVAACTSFVAGFEAPDGAADDGSLFGPPVPVADDADPLSRLLGLTGRDPAWRPGA